MERLARRDEKRDGMSRSALRLWGLMFALLGILGRAVLQNALLDMGNITNDQLLEAMLESSQVMTYATLALVMQAMEACAVPIFAFLLVEGVQKTSNLEKYLLRVVALALISELPYNLAMSGSLLDVSSRNPVLGLAFGVAMLYLYKVYGGDTMGKRLLRIVITAAAILWSMMLQVQDGAFCVIMVLVLWLCRNKVQYRTFIGCAAAACCSLILGGRICTRVQAAAAARPAFCAAICCGRWRPVLCAAFSSPPPARCSPPSPDVRARASPASATP